MSVPIPNQPAPVRKRFLGAGLLFWVALVLVAVLVGVAYLEINRGRSTRGRVRKLLSGVRAEERSNVPRPGWQAAVDDIIETISSRITGKDKWQGEYYYQKEIVKLGTNAVPELLSALSKSPSVAVRRVSANALAELPAPGVLTGLTNALLRDVDGEVRKAVASALSNLNDTNSVSALLASLHSDKVADVRAEDVSSLAGLGGAELVPALLAVGRIETEDSVRSQIAEAVGNYSDARGVPLLVEWLGLREKPASENTPGYPRRRSDYYDYSDGNRLVTSSAQALGQIGGDAAFQALVKRWEGETNAQICAGISEALGNMGDARALPLLLSALQKEQDTERQGDLVEALGKLSDTNAVPALLPFLESPEKDMRRKAAAALGAIGGSAAAESLKRVADQDTEVEVRLQACAALGLIGVTSAQQTLLDAIPRLGNNRQEAVWALGHIADSNAIPLLNSLLDDNERETRFAAAYALAEIGGPTAAETLAGKLSDRDEYARFGKACALAILGQTNGMPAIREGLTNGNDWQHFGAVLSYVRIGAQVDDSHWALIKEHGRRSLLPVAEGVKAGQGIGALTPLLRDRDKDLRTYAARGLVFYHDSSTLPALREAARDPNSEVRQAARVTARCIERQTAQRN